MEEKKLYDYTDPYGDKYKLGFAKDMYTMSGGLYVEAYFVGELGSEPYTDVTVNLMTTPPGSMAYLDGDLPEQFIEWLEGIGAGKRTGRKDRSGWAEYELFDFDPEWLECIEGDYPYLATAKG